MASYIEIAKYYNREDFDNWRSAAWWERGEWANFLPKEEHHRIDKYRNQACKKFNKGNMEGHQFVEVLEMIGFKRIGYKWLHANYYLFKEVKPTARVYGPGTDTIRQIIGKDKIDYLVNIVANKSLKAVEPDLFVYRLNQKESNKFDMFFVECKNKDALRPEQLTGFDLINKYLKIPIVVIRYFEK